MFDFLLEQSGRKSNGLPKYHFETAAEILTPIRMKEAHDAFKLLCTSGKRISNSVNPPETLSVKDCMQYISKEIIKTRKQRK